MPDSTPNPNAGEAALTGDRAMVAHHAAQELHGFGNLEANSYRRADGTHFISIKHREQVGMEGQLARATALQNFLAAHGVDIGSGGNIKFGRNLDVASPNASVDANGNFQSHDYIEIPVQGMDEKEFTRVNELLKNAVTTGEAGIAPEAAAQLQNRPRPTPAEWNAALERLGQDVPARNARTQAGWDDFTFYVPDAFADDMHTGLTLELVGTITNDVSKMPLAHVTDGEKEYFIKPVSESQARAHTRAQSLLPKDSIIKYAPAHEIDPFTLNSPIGQYYKEMENRRLMLIDKVAFEPNMVNDLIGQGPEGSAQQALDSRLRGQPITAAEQRQILSELRQLSDAGVIHGDLPANMSFERGENGKLTMHVIDPWPEKAAGRAVHDMDDVRGIFKDMAKAHTAEKRQATSLDDISFKPHPQANHPEYEGATLSERVKLGEGRTASIVRFGNGTYEIAVFDRSNTLVHDPNIMSEGMQTATVMNREDVMDVLRTAAQSKAGEDGVIIKTRDYPAHEEKQARQFLETLQGQLSAEPGDIVKNQNWDRTTANKGLTRVESFTAHNLSDEDYNKVRTALDDLKIEYHTIHTNPNLVKGVNDIHIRSKHSDDFAQLIDAAPRVKPDMAELKPHIDRAFAELEQAALQDAKGSKNIQMGEVLVRLMDDKSFPPNTVRSALEQLVTEGPSKPYARVAKEFARPMLNYIPETNITGKLAPKATTSEAPAVQELNKRHRTGPAGGAALEDGLPNTGERLPAQTVQDRARARRMEEAPNPKIMGSEGADTLRSNDPSPSESQLKFTGDRQSDVKLPELGKPQILLKEGHSHHGLVSVETEYSPQNMKALKEAGFEKLAIRNQLGADGKPTGKQFINIDLGNEANAAKYNELTGGMHAEMVDQLQKRSQGIAPERARLAGIEKQQAAHAAKLETNSELKTKVEEYKGLSKNTADPNAAKVAASGEYAEARRYIEGEKTLEAAHEIATARHSEATQDATSGKSSKSTGGSVDVPAGHRASAGGNAGGFAVDTFNTARAIQSGDTEAALASGGSAATNAIALTDDLLAAAGKSSGFVSNVIGKAGIAGTAVTTGMEVLKLEAEGGYDRREKQGELLTTGAIGLGAGIGGGAAATAAAGALGLTGFAAGAAATGGTLLIAGAAVGAVTGTNYVLNNALFGAEENRFGANLEDKRNLKGLAGKFHDQLADPKTGKIDWNDTTTLNKYDVLLNREVEKQEKAIYDNSSMAPEWMRAAAGSESLQNKKEAQANLQIAQSAQAELKQLRAEQMEVQQSVAKINSLDADKNGKVDIADLDRNKDGKLDNADAAAIRSQLGDKLGDRFLANMGQQGVIFDGSKVADINARIEQKDQLARADHAAEKIIGDLPKDKDGKLSKEGLLAKFDTDGDGHLTIQDKQAMMAQLKEQGGEALGNALFKKLDAKGVAFEGERGPQGTHEMLADKGLVMGGSGMRDLAPEAKQMLDTNKDGKISKEESLVLDSNKDGKITRGEIADYVTRNEKDSKKAETLTLDQRAMIAAIGGQLKNSGVQVALNDFSHGAKAPTAIAASAPVKEQGASRT